MTLLLRLRVAIGVRGRGLTAQRHTRRVVALARFCHVGWAGDARDVSIGGRHGGRTRSLACWRRGRAVLQYSGRGEKAYNGEMRRNKIVAASRPQWLEFGAKREAA